MWDAYTISSESVVIVTSAKALYTFVASLDGFMASPVKYHDSDFARSEFGWNTLFFYKPAEFAYEREFRILRVLRQDESVRLANPNDECKYVPIPAKKVIHRVITHPKASRPFKDEVERLIRVNLKRITREDSVLHGR